MPWRCVTTPPRQASNFLTRPFEQSPPFPLAVIAGPNAIEGSRRSAAPVTTSASLAAPSSPP
eukprot:scaffold294790_cov22-Tisochrysis_lutea.AAC.1